MAQMKKVFVRGNVASLFGLSILRSYDFLAFPFRPETALSASSNASVLLISNSPWIFPAKIWVERLVSSFSAAMVCLWSMTGKVLVPVVIPHVCRVG